ncbi:hypothetical protein HUJ05_000784 [Dendroctonus ponderosae]|nr:hypothetical protein HUJ05_000784 [Dendroctonus ponderosae]
MYFIEFAQSISFNFDPGYVWQTSTRNTIDVNNHLKRLVKEPLQVFDDLLGKNGVLLKHQRNQYHDVAVEAGIFFN